MEYFQIIFNQIFIFAIYIVTGMIAVKTAVICQKDLQIISNIIIKITMPIMLFRNTLHGATKEQFIHTMPFLVLAAVMFLCLYMIFLGMAKLFRLKGDMAKVYRATSMFGNVGFMGIPIIAALFPEEGMLYIALFTVVDQLLLWTLGVQLTMPGTGESSFAEKIQKAKKMLNPSTAAIILAMIGVVAGIILPSGIDTALEKVGNITSPLALIYLGGLFCFTNMKDSIKRKEFYGTVLVKMLLFPFCFYQIAGAFPGIDAHMRLAITVLSAMPSMSSVAMLAEAQNSEGSYSACEVFLTTLCCVVTLPVLCLIISQW